jgi:hypothetical protein
VNTVIAMEPGLLDKDAAEAFLGKARVLRVCREAGWIVPVEQRGTMVLYSVTHLKELVAKIEREGLPKRGVRQ